MSGLHTYADVVNEVRAEFPQFRMVNKKASTLMKAINVCLTILSFGSMREFMTRFVTTVGYTIYVPDGWSDRGPLSRAVTIRHERIHMRQRKRMGAVLFSLTYLFWVFPVGFALGRRDLECEAYTESLRASVEYFGASALVDQELRERIIKHFTSAEYLWMWPFRSSVEAWYDNLVEELRQELVLHVKRS